EAELDRPVRPGLLPARPRPPPVAALLSEVPLAPSLRAPAHGRRPERRAPAARRGHRPFLPDPRPGEPLAGRAGRPGPPPQAGPGPDPAVLPARRRRQPHPLAFAALVLVGVAQRLRPEALSQLRHLQPLVGGVAGGRDLAPAADPDLRPALRDVRRGG